MNTIILVKVTIKILRRAILHYLDMFKQSVPICFNLFFTISHLPLCLLFIKRKCFETHQKILYSIFLLFNIFQILLAWLCSLVVMLSGDVEVNTGPKKKDKDGLPICYWNLNMYLSEAATGGVL